MIGFIDNVDYRKWLSASIQEASLVQEAQIAMVLLNNLISRIYRKNQPLTSELELQFIKKAPPSLYCFPLAYIIAHAYNLLFSPVKSIVTLSDCLLVLQRDYNLDISNVQFEPMQIDQQQLSFWRNELYSGMGATEPICTDVLIRDALLVDFVFNAECSVSVNGLNLPFQKTSHAYQIDSADFVSVSKRLNSIADATPAHELIISNLIMHETFSSHMNPVHAREQASLPFLSFYISAVSINSKSSLWFHDLILKGFAKILELREFKNNDITALQDTFKSYLSINASSAQKRHSFLTSISTQVWILLRNLTWAANSEKILPFMAQFLLKFKLEDDNQFGFWDMAHFVNSCDSDVIAYIFIRAGNEKHSKYYRSSILLALDSGMSHENLEISDAYKICFLEVLGLLSNPFAHPILREFNESAKSNAMQNLLTMIDEEKFLFFELRGAISKSSPTELKKIDDDVEMGEIEEDEVDQDMQVAAEFLLKNNLKRAGSPLHGEPLRVSLEENIRNPLIVSGILSHVDMDSFQRHGKTLELLDVWIAISVTLRSGVFKKSLLNAVKNYYPCDQAKLLEFVIARFVFINRWTHSFIVPEIMEMIESRSSFSILESPFNALAHGFTEMSDHEAPFDSSHVALLKAMVSWLEKRFDASLFKPFSKKSKSMPLETIKSLTSGQLSNSCRFITSALILCPRVYLEEYMELLISQAYAKQDCLFYEWLLCSIIENSKLESFKITSLAINIMLFGKHNEDNGSLSDFLKAKPHIIDLLVPVFDSQDAIDQRENKLLIYRIFNSQYREGKSENTDIVTFGRVRETYSRYSANGSKMESRLITLESFEDKLLAKEILIRAFCDPAKFFFVPLSKAANILNAWMCAFKPLPNHHSASLLMEALEKYLIRSPVLLLNLFSQSINGPESLRLALAGYIKTFSVDLAFIKKALKAVISSADPAMLNDLLKPHFLTSTEYSMLLAEAVYLELLEIQTFLLIKKAFNPEATRIIQNLFRIAKDWISWDCIFGLEILAKRADIAGTLVQLLTSTKGQILEAILDLLQTLYQAILNAGDLPWLSQAIQSLDVNWGSNIVWIYQNKDGNSSKPLSKVSKVLLGIFARHNLKSYASAFLHYACSQIALGTLSEDDVNDLIFGICMIVERFSISKDPAVSLISKLILATPNYNNGSFCDLIAALANAKVKLSAHVIHTSMRVTNVKSMCTSLSKVIEALVNSDIYMSIMIDNLPQIVHIMSKSNPKDLKRITASLATLYGKLECGEMQRFARILVSSIESAEVVIGKKALLGDAQRVILMRPNPLT